MGRIKRRKGCDKLYRRICLTVIGPFIYTILVLTYNNNDNENGQGAL